MTEYTEQSRYAEPVVKIERSVSMAAADKRMTVGELRQFVAALDQAGVPNDVQVKGRTTMSGHLGKIEV